MNFAINHLQKLKLRQNLKHRESIKIVISLSIGKLNHNF